MLALVQVEITERGTRVEARTRYPSGDDRRRSDRRNFNVSVAYTVAAPEGTRIMVKSISGNISVRDILGGLTLETVSGAVRVANAGRTVNGRSISGDIELNDTKVEGALEAGTISGTVRLRRLTARSLALNSVSGNVEMEDVTAERMGAQSISGNITFAGDLQPNGRYEFTSHSGNVRIAIPAATGFQLEASSFSGSINTDIPITMANTPGRGAGGRRSRALRGTAGERRRGPRSHDLLGHDRHREALAGASRGIVPGARRLPAVGISATGTGSPAPAPQPLQSANPRKIRPIAKAELPASSGTFVAHCHWSVSRRMSI